MEHLKRSGDTLILRRNRRAWAACLAECMVSSVAGIRRRSDDIRVWVLLGSSFRNLFGLGCPGGCLGNPRLQLYNRYKIQWVCYTTLVRSETSCISEKVSFYLDRLCRTPPSVQSESECTRDAVRRLIDLVCCRSISLDWKLCKSFLLYIDT